MVRERGRLCTRPLRKDWILLVEQVRQDIPREGKELGKAWRLEGHGGEVMKRQGCLEQSCHARECGSLECQTGALRLGFLGHA